MVTICVRTIGKKQQQTLVFVKAAKNYEHKNGNVVRMLLMIHNKDDDLTHVYTTIKKRTIAFLYTNTAENYEPVRKIIVKLLFLAPKLATSVF